MERLFKVKSNFDENFVVLLGIPWSFRNRGWLLKEHLKSMCDEKIAFHGDLIAECEHERNPSNDVDSMARIAWAAAQGAAGGGEDCSWSELTRALNLIWRTEVSAADLLAPQHLHLLAEKLQVLIAANYLNYVRKEGF